MPFDHGFRLIVNLYVIYLSKVTLFTKSAFCKELKILLKNTEFSHL